MKKFLAPLFVSLCALPVHAMLASDMQELERSEQEQERRIKAVRERVKTVSKAVREKSRTFHALQQTSGSASFVWEDDTSSIGRQKRMEKLLQISIREALKEIDSLEAQESDLRADLELIQTRMKEAANAPEAPEADAPAVAVATNSFRCEALPVEPAEGRSLSLLQDFGTRKDSDTGIEWRSLGWWIGQLGRQVHACSGGTVVFSGKVPGRGRVIVLDHGAGGMTLYANLNDDPEISLRKGERVASGRVLGSPREKLYFEVRRHGAAVNPREALPVTNLAKFGI